MKNKLFLLSIFIFLGQLLSFASCPGDTARFSSNGPKCKSDSVTFTDASVIEVGSGILSWSWNFGDPGSGINNISSQQNPKHLFSAGNQTFFVKLVVVYMFGCVDSVTNGVGIQSLVIANAGSNITSCKNNLTVNLVGSITNAGGGSWTGSGGFSNSSSLTPIYTPTSAAKASGTDTVILTSFSPAFCPNVSDTVVITFNNGPVVNVGPNISVCKDTSGVPLSATITGATGGIWHTISTGTAGTFTNTFNPSTIYFPSTTDTAAGSVIIYRESTGNGICSASSDSVTITFTPTPVVLIKTSDSSCSRSPIILDVTTTTGSGFWHSSGSGTFTPNNTSLGGFYIPSAADDLAGMITLKFTSTNNGGCHSTFDTLDVSIKPSPKAGFSSVSKCALVPMQFTDTSVSSSIVDHWKWDFDDTSPFTTSQNPSHIYATGGPYNVSLIVTAANGCKDTAIQVVNVYRIPIAIFTELGMCLNTGASFTNTSTVTGATIATSHWNFGDNVTSVLPNPTHFFATSGSYPVTLITSTSQGCYDTLTQTVPVSAGPTAAFTASDATANIDQSVTFTDQSTTVISRVWNFGDGSSGSSQQNPSHTYTVAGVYNVCLIVTDGNTCKDTVCETEIVSTHPAGPSGFSPNADGQNDVFKVFGGPFKTFNLRVYNAWGELIFESFKQSDGWDGKRNGVDQPIGVYVYTVVGTTEDDNEYKLSGDITLLR